MAGNLTKMLILCWKPEFRIFMYILKFSVIFFTEGRKSCFQNLCYWEISTCMLLRNIHIHSLNLLNFIYIDAFDIQIILENAKSMVQERLELQIFFASS